MIPRYSLPRMGKVWSDENRYRAWWRVELAVLEAWHRRGLLNEKELAKIRDVSFSPTRMAEIEKTTRHDVIAFLTTFAEQLGPESRFIHYGMTSSDMLDTANACLLLEASSILLEDIDEACKVIGKGAIQHKKTIMVGRTHGVHAEPTTFGLKLAGWYSEMVRNRKRLERARDAVGVGKISGAVGNFAHLEPEIEEEVCHELGLQPASISTQIIQRDRYAEFVWALAMIATSLEKFAVELRSLQRTEIGEVEEGFSPGQKGSSAMPHKKNPITGEQICGLSRVVRGHLVTALENVPLWHERDISHSSAERIILPDSCVLVDYLLQAFCKLMERLVVHPQRMRENLESSRGLVFSERVLLALVRKGLQREEAYHLVQRCARSVWENMESNFIQAVLHDTQIRSLLDEEEITSLFDERHFLRHVDTLFQRVGLGG